MISATTMRRQHRLATGHRSRGFVPIEVESSDARISCEALGLLVRIRRAADQRETDGILDARALNALAADAGMTRRRVGRLLKELAAAGVVEQRADGVIDANFLTWCQSHSERDEKRADWRDRKDKSRRDSSEASPRDTSQVSPNTAADAEAEAPSEAASKCLSKGSAHLRSDEYQCLRWLVGRVPVVEQRLFLDDFRIWANRKTGGVRNLDAWGFTPPAEGRVPPLEEFFGEWRDGLLAHAKHQPIPDLPGLEELAVKLRMPAA